MDKTMDMIKLPIQDIRIVDPPFWMIMQLYPLVQRGKPSFNLYVGVNHFIL
jgi:hypothetical protein